MKALAASSIGQYEKSVSALADYNRTVELGLSVCFRGAGSAAFMTGETRQADASEMSAVVFGSDQGLVGQFNDVVADYAMKTLAALPGKPHVWAVGERVHARLTDAGLPSVGLFAVPNSVKAITPLVGRILVESEARRSPGEVVELYLFYNRPASARERAVLKNMSVGMLEAKTLAGDPIHAKLTTAPGNNAPIGGLKVASSGGWFAARPSGTEDVYKIYAESFKGQAHLRHIQEEAMAMVAASLKAASI
jgi:hypothetical protein